MVTLAWIALLFPILSSKPQINKHNTMLYYVYIDFSSKKYLDFEMDDHNAVIGRVEWQRKWSIQDWNELDGKKQRQWFQLVTNFDNNEEASPINESSSLQIQWEMLLSWWFLPQTIVGTLCPTPTITIMSTITLAQVLMKKRQWDLSTIALVIVFLFPKLNFKSTVWFSCWVRYYDFFLSVWI